jgi:DNA-binding transcriptional LysR family regulator
MAKARSALKRLKETRSAAGRGPVASSNTKSGASVMLFGFLPLASAHLLDRAPQFVVESATRHGIVAQALECNSDALRFGNRSVGIVA